MAGLDAGVQSRLAPQLNQFQANYRQVEIGREPTTSGWTWLFLTWALANSVENSHLEADKRAMQARVDELERKLRQEPSEWESLQLLSTNSSFEKQEEGEEIGAPAQVEQEAPSAMAQSAAPQPTDGANDAFNALSDGLQKLLPIACVLMVAWIGFVISFRRGLH